MRTLLTATLASMIALSPMVAMAQAACGPRDKIVSIIKKRYGEQPAYIGVLHNGLIMEILVSPKGTWTTLLTSPNNQSCIKAVGTDWMSRKTHVNGKDA